MMNSSHPNELYASFPFMAFVGIEGDGSTQTGQKHQLWDFDSTNGLFPTSPFFDSSTPLATTNPIFPLYLPPLFPSAMAIPNYPHSAASADDRLPTAPRIRLNLGNRTYFSSADHHVPPKCQADGCTADLSAAKHYHRRHKVCEFHSKAAIVFLPGRFQQRFCQQCSRFHELAEFDNAKRSCRKSLTGHNRRRRNPQWLTSAKPTSAWSSSPMTIPKEESIENALTRFTTDSGLSLGGVALPVQLQREPVHNASEEDRCLQYHELQQQSHVHHESPFPERSHSMEGGSEMTHYNQSGMLQPGQAMFEWDFI